MSKRRAYPRPSLGHVCVIEDNEDLRRLLCTALRRAGFSAVGARDGREGIQIVERTQPSVVVTDIVMPNREGLETIKELQDRFADVRILAISGAGSSGPNVYLQLALALGADDALAKPFEMAEFVARVATLCK